MDTQGGSSILAREAGAILKAGVPLGISRGCSFVLWGEVSLGK